MRTVAIAAKGIPELATVDHPLLLVHEDVVHQPAVTTGRGNEHRVIRSMCDGPTIREEIVEEGTMLARGVRCRTPEHRRVPNQRLPSTIQCADDPGSVIDGGCANGHAVDRNWQFHVVY